ncbi:MAG: LysR family transcriptional regulator [Candidatus Binataceae bacterium]
MDMDQVRTFLEVVEAGSFVRAAESLNVTQSTVSARIKELEVRLGQPLFIRRKSGVALTTAGKRFQPHAATMMHVLQQARQDIALPAEMRAVLNVGGQFSLWERFLLGWMGQFRAGRPDVAVRAEVGTPESLMRHLSDGLLDFVVMYAPEARPGFQIEKLMDESLVMVATRKGHAGPGEPDYVLVDWGPDFDAWHSDQFPQYGMPGLHVSLGALGLRHILSHGGAGYFPARVVAPEVANATLFPVRGAPTFVRPAHVIYPSESDSEVRAAALASLKAAAAADAGDLA